MDAQLDGPILVASLLILSVLGGSAVLWIREAQRPRDHIRPDVGVAPWNIGWINFGIFMSTLVTAVVAFQYAGASVIFPEGAPPPEALTPWLAVAAILLLQLPMLAVFYAARRFYPEQFADRLSEVRLPRLGAAKKALVLFIMLLPIVWLVTLVWSNLLFAVESIGWLEDVKPQELVTLFGKGGSPFAIGILVVMAVVLAPFVEEIIFRGCIYRFLKSQTSLLLAQALSGAVFAMLHANLLSFVPLMLVGILLARVYEKTGSLAVAIWFHAFFNAFSLSMLLITRMSDHLPAY